MQAQCRFSTKTLACLAKRKCGSFGWICEGNGGKSPWTTVASPVSTCCGELLKGCGGNARETSTLKRWSVIEEPPRRSYCRITKYLLQNYQAQHEAAYEAVRVREHANASGFSFQTFEDHLFEALSNEAGKVPVSQLLSGLRNVGLQQDDPRLKESMLSLRQAQTVATELESGAEVLLDRISFKDCIKDNIELIKRAFTGDFIIPEFRKFTNVIDTLYWHGRSRTEGHVATYIPQLSRYNPDYWGVSVCTVDGQRHSIGDTSIPFSMQSCSKPLTYALALHDLGADVLHQYIGMEPSGESFNQLKLNPENKPHNPLINAGAIVCASLLKSSWALADRYEFVRMQYKKMAGGGYLGFNNAIFLSERETADRNRALAYYMKENKCFPDGTDLNEILDFYFQLCSIEITSESGSVMAATLANGGICPITGEHIFGSEAVRDTLSLMHSCGMYDYSGQFAFQVGLPAKSGVSGGVLLVIPNIMGICVWSPPVDTMGNSVRGLNFCIDLVKNFNFHNYDNLRHTRRKIDPRKRRIESLGERVVGLLFSAHSGDLTALRRMSLGGVDMEQADYDGRTALHLAAAEGHLNCVQFLIEKCKVPSHPKDRWEHTPCDDARKFERHRVAEYLEKLEAKDSSSLEG